MPELIFTFFVRNNQVKFVKIYKLFSKKKTFSVFLGENERKEKAKRRFWRVKFRANCSPYLGLSRVDPSPPTPALPSPSHHHNSPSLTNYCRILWVLKGCSHNKGSIINEHNFFCSVESCFWELMSHQGKAQTRQFCLLKFCLWIYLLYTGTPPRYSSPDLFVSTCTISLLDNRYLVISHASLLLMMWKVL